MFSKPRDHSSIVALVNCNSFMRSFYGELDCKKQRKNIPTMVLMGFVGPRGDKLASKATLLVVLVVSQVIYGCLGIFGAARHGLATSGNVLINEWLPLRAQVSGPQIYLGFSDQCLRQQQSQSKLHLNALEYERPCLQRQLREKRQQRESVTAIQEGVHNFSRDM